MPVDGGVATMIPGTSMSFQDHLIGDSMSTQMSSQSSLTALSIRELPPSERPRERLVALGACALSSVELELQYELIEIKENKGLGLAFFGGYGFATRGGDADEIEFGPIVELGTGDLLLTFNPIFGAQVGENRETDGLGFEYGWRAEYDFAKHWGIGVEMFGEIEDLANAGSFDDQNHSIGPTLFWNPGSEEEEAKGGDEDEDNNKVPGRPNMELCFNVGVQFGLTDVTSDGALKFQGSLAW